MVWPRARGGGEGWCYWRTEVGSIRGGLGGLVEECLYAGHLPHQMDSLFKKVVFQGNGVGFGLYVGGHDEEGVGCFRE